MLKKISTHLVEIRYVPDPRFIDKRGSVAMRLANGSQFDNWSITKDRVDFTHSKDNDRSAFYSFRNIGYSSKPPVTKNEFLKGGKLFLQNAWPDFSISKIERIGIRSRYLVETESFDHVFYILKEKLLKLNQSELKDFGGDLVDIAFPLNFVNGDDYFNISIGPMEKEQSDPIFGDAAYKSGLFVDVDYFRTDISPHITQKNIFKFIEIGAEKAESITAMISSWFKE